MGGECSAIQDREAARGFAKAAFRFTNFHSWQWQEARLFLEWGAQLVHRACSMIFDGASRLPAISFTLFLEKRPGAKRPSTCSLQSFWWLGSSNDSTGRANQKCCASSSHAEVLNAVKLGVDVVLLPPRLSDLTARSFQSPATQLVKAACQAEEPAPNSYKPRPWRGSCWKRSSR